MISHHFKLAFERDTNVALGIGAGVSGATAAGISIKNKLRDVKEDAPEYRYKTRKEFIKALKPGDIIYNGYKNTKNRIPYNAHDLLQLATGTEHPHTAVYLGKGRIVHSLGYGDTMDTSDIDWSVKGHRVKAYRITDKKQIEPALKYLRGLAKKKVPYKGPVGTLSQGFRMLLDPTGGPKTCRKIDGGIVCNSAINKAYPNTIKNEYAHINEVRSTKGVTYIGHYNNVGAPTVKETLTKRVLYPSIKSIPWGLGAAALAYGGKKTYDYLKE